MRSLAERQRRQDYLACFQPVKTFLEESWDQQIAIVCKPVKPDFGQLTKNNLQNVMEFFPIWGRDFCILRQVNKRFNAAYLDQLTKVVNTDVYLQSVHE